jgi:hypothetical protein
MVCRETCVEEREDKQRKRGGAFIHFFNVRGLTMMTVKTSILGCPAAMRMWNQGTIR